MNKEVLKEEDVGRITVLSFISDGPPDTTQILIILITSKKEN